MTGLDLESFLLLLRADLSVWLMLALATSGLGFLVWASWSSRRALRNCLVVSFAGHLAFVLFGSTFPGILWRLTPNRRPPNERSHIREIRVATLVDQAKRPGPVPIVSSGAPKPIADEKTRPQGPRWDLVDVPLPIADAQLRVGRPKNLDQQKPELQPNLAETVPAAATIATPKGAQLAAVVRAPEARPPADSKSSADPPAAEAPLPPDVAYIDAGLDASKTAKATEDRAREEPKAPVRGAILALRTDRRLRPDRPKRSSGENLAARTATNSASAGPGGNPRTSPSGPPTSRGLTEKAESPALTRPLDVPAITGNMDPIPTIRATPKARSNGSGGNALAALSDRTGRSDLVDIPKIYLPRIDPDRSTLAQRIGASAASELAVERAIDWLTRHQDEDGRWNAGIARYADGTAVKGDDDYTAHCPPGETCFGECAYWEADTALSGLALLTYLGAGYTHRDGRYADNVGRGLDFLLSQQKRDGDLRGRSRVVGMYCHAMATLALNEAYALTGDSRLRDPAERAVAFMVKARATDGLAWRYAPGAPAGDTSILGWVVMGLKSAKETGIRIPNETSIREGTLSWLEQVATGDAKGLARYQPWEPVTPTMTAEAWVCRQFLGVGGPGPASSEAADFLQRNESDRGSTNVYYWYYATLALYQHGGEAWSRWNARLRDKLVGLQRNSGHQAGSWEPDNSLYGSKGGRIYCTALAALTLEVYYRYLRLYDEPKIPLEAGVTPARR
jgi:hypothetical protein